MTRRRPRRADSTRRLRHTSRGAAALLKAIGDALPQSDSLRMGFDTAGYQDQPLCCAIKEWAASHAAPDGTQAWEDATMAVAIPAATLRRCGATPAQAYRRVGALHTFRWLVRDLTFKAKPGSLDLTRT